MFLLNLKLFIRNINKHKSTFLINILGLSTGIACALLIYLWVHEELSMDQFHAKGAKLYQVMTNFHGPDAIETWEGTPLPLAASFKELFPEIETCTRINNDFIPTGNITYQANSFETNRIFADTNFFDVFSYKLVHGNSKQVLSDKNSIALSESLAVKLFQTSSNAIGKIVEWRNPYFKGNYLVTGVFANPGVYSSEQFDAVIPMDKLVETSPGVNRWPTNRAETYLVLDERTDISKFNEQIEFFMWSKVPTRKTNRLFVQKYDEKYLHNYYENGKPVGGRIEYVKYFSLFALFILLIACINFINLSTAQASQKMREIGVKKSIGASRPTLVLQFLGESILMACLSLIAAVGIIFLVLPQFNEITGKSLTLNLEPNLLYSIAGIVLFTGLLAGSHPAFYLSGFNPIAVLKGVRNSSLSEHRIRRVLVIFQFAIAVIFTVGVLVIDKQMQYTQSKHLGYNRDNIISFQRPRDNDDMAAFLAELKRIPGATHVSHMNGGILDGRSDQGGYSWRGQAADEKWIFKSPQVSFDLIETLGMQILEGRSFSEAYQDDDSRIIINESARRMMQLEDPIGKTIKNINRRLEIIGVVSDFHYGSLHQKVKPLIFRLEHWGLNMMVKIQSGTEKRTIQQIEAVYKKFHPEYAFNYSFLDEDNIKLYATEGKVAILSKYFALLAIIISCLGLFALAAFTVERRKREIGIRKALGQTATQVSLLLTQEFAYLVLIALFIGLPVGFILLRNWLSTFAYKIDLHTGYFFMAGVIVLMIALLTVSSQAIRAASRNPIEALREE